jgi:hypothetical protein
MSRAQKEMYKMRPPTDIFKPIMLVKEKKNGAYRQQNFKELKGAAASEAAASEAAAPAKGGKKKSRRGRKTRRTQKRTKVSRRSRTKSRR